MKIAIAQINSKRANILLNVDKHIKWIQSAVSEKSDMIVFPELSLTAYEPTLANELAVEQNDLALEPFQVISDRDNITIAVGIPTKFTSGIYISLIIFQPSKSRLVYSKQNLHADEMPFFVEGKEQLILNTRVKNVAPAICYESLREDHLLKATQLGADIYIASVAKPQKGIEKAQAHFPNMAKKYSIPILMSNCVGKCDDFIGAGQSAVWDSNGKLKGILDSEKEGLLIFDTETNDIRDL